MSLEVVTYQAFTAATRGGNRADVVFGADVGSERQMQGIAASTGAPATVFVGVSERLLEAGATMPLRLRFFTPEIEESICGHGTIAALTALQTRGGFNGFQLPDGVFQLETNLGLQSAEFTGGTAWLEYGDVQAWEIEHESVGTQPVVPSSPEQVAVALGLEPEDLHEDLPVLGAGVGRTKLVCAVPSAMILDAIEPDLEAVKRLCNETDTTGVVAFTFPGRGGCFTDTRHFSVQGSTVLEDAATGNAHAALAGYLAARQFFDDGARGFSGAQGYAMQQPSRLEVRMTVFKSAANSVWVGGKALEVRL